MRVRLVYLEGGKRATDVVVSVGALVVMSPLIALVALAVRLMVGRGVMFRQIRPGLNGSPFTLVKFRTMTDERDDRGDLLPDSVRLTGFGRWLRSTSLDELPELWNVLRGDMSLVGPRPLLMEYLMQYTPQQARRHNVRPGLTGWAQVNGRNAASWKKRLEMDVWYVDHVSFCLDARIIGRTLVKVIRREGIAAEGEATSRPFTG